MEGVAAPEIVVAVVDPASGEVLGGRASYSEGDIGGRMSR